MNKLKSRLEAANASEGIEQEAALKIIAAEIVDAECGYCADADDIVLTRDSLDSFWDHWAGGYRNVNIDLPNAQFDNIQPGGKGTPRKSLVVIDMGEWRATFVV